MKSLRLWAHGLAAAFVGGAAATLTSLAASPALLTAPGGLKQIGLTALAAGAITAAAYLVKSPIPDDAVEAAPATPAASPK